jgi:hypothetical protein
MRSIEDFTSHQFIALFAANFKPLRGTAQNTMHNIFQPKFHVHRVGLWYLRPAVTRGQKYALNVSGDKGDGTFQINMAACLCMAVCPLEMHELKYHEFCKNP